MAIASCCDAGGNLDPAILGLWLHCLEPIPIGAEVRAGIPGPTAPPDPRRWHKSFIGVIDGIAEEGGRLPPLSRHFAQKAALVYPPADQLQAGFIENLATPEGPQHYDTVFQRALEQAKQAWGELGQALADGAAEPFTLANADLDTGKDLTGRFLFWSAQA